MASNDLPPRQKMVGVMYLVLMAMLALNVSKEVLEAFITINETVQNTNIQSSKKNAIVYNDLSFRAQNNPEKYSESNKKASELKEKSQKVFDLIDQMKDDLLQQYATFNEITKKPDGASLDNQDAAGIYLWGTPGSTKGEDLKKGLEDYKEYALKIANNDEIKERIKIDFNTDPIVDPKEGIKTPWLEKTFSHYPLAAVIAFMSNIQAKIRNTESDLVTSMLQSDATGGIAVNKIKAISIPTTNYVMRGAPFKSDVLIAAYDSTSIPEILLYSKFDSNGKPVGQPKTVPVENGVGKVVIETGTLGFFDWGGILKLKDDLGQVTEYPFRSSYQVSEPTVVISALKMNVMYRGVQNPISVSVPGIASEDLIVSAPVIKNVGNGIYNVDVTSIRGREVKIKVSAKLPTGDVKAFPDRIYRVKEIPTPMGSLRGDNEASMPLTNMKLSTVGAFLKDFEFEMKLKVSSFSVKIPGSREYNVRGNAFSAEVKKKLNRVPVGEVIQIRNIKAEIKGNSSYRIPKVIPALITISSK